MNTKIRSLLAAAIIVASLPLLSTANRSNDKVTLCHNGHLITIAQPAVQHHLDNHNREGAKLTCYVVTADRPCGSGKPPKPGCPPEDHGCQ